METFSALPAFCAGNSPVTGEFPAQRPVTRSFDVLFYLRFGHVETVNWANNGDAGDLRLCSLWRHCNVICFLTPEVADSRHEHRYTQDLLHKSIMSYFNIFIPYQLI